MRPKLFLAVWLVLLAAGAAGAGETPPFAFDRYHEPEAIAARMRQLALTHPDVARVHELATSPGGRPLLVLEIGPETAAPAHRLPAVLVAANLEGSVPVASEAAQYLAQVLLDKPEARGDRTWYIAPLGNPDAAARFFRRPLVEDNRNDRPFNDDQDDRIDEDGPDDLNGDGLITQMRVPDPAGEWIPVEGEPRALRKADWSKGEKGQFKLYTEGIDNDGDGRYNEDGPGGVDVGLNFPHLFKPFTPTGGAWAGSEAESYALVAFAFAHPEIALVVTFGRSNFCLNPPRGGRTGTADFNRIKIPERIAKWIGLEADKTYTMAEVMEVAKRLAPPGMELTEAMVASFLGLGPVVNPLPEDLKFYEVLSKQYNEFLKDRKLDAKRLDPPADRDGSFELWAYYHLGRPSFAMDFWTLPVVEKAKPAGADPDALTPDKLETMTSGEFLALGEEKIAAFIKSSGAPSSIQPAMVINAVKAGMMTPKKMAEMMKTMPKPKSAEGLDTESEALLAFSDKGLGGAGYVTWQPFQHPTLGALEIGGAAPYATGTPPPAQLLPLLEGQVPWVLTLADKMARIRLTKVEVTALGGGIHRVKAWVENTGYLPYTTAMAQRNSQYTPVVLELKGAGLRFLEGRPRSLVRQVAGHGAETVTWLVQTDQPVSATITATTATAWGDEISVQLGGVQ
ncbi:MAG TPA: M14 family metallopeptidase [Acidobacteriota bacterium]|nr:M14 family metallopeptidase [Acidobacteriota bacterium]HQG90415.1 M14 family metallopeptidase [Acidobacteriota bacterium]